MRKLLVVAAMMVMAQGAEAADMPDLPILRGAMTDGLTSSRTIWHGYYAGVQAGYGSSDSNFTGSTSALTSRILANTTIESEMGVSQWPLSIGRTSERSAAFGGFVGYNSQWDDVVLGLEANYMHGKFGGKASGSQDRFTGNPLSDGLWNDVTSSATASISIKDMGTLRARAGYAFGSFLPYMFAGGAFANADINRTASIVDVIYTHALPPFTNPASTFSPTLSNAQPNHLITGYTAGIGVDVNLIGGLFMRAEWEYVRFTTSVDTSINTLRAGLGYKF